MTRTDALVPVLLGAVLLAACGGGSGGAGSASPSPASPSAVPAPPSPSGCAATVTGVPGAVAGAGGQFTLTVTAASGCAWSAQSDAGWASIAPSSGSGSGTPVLTVQQNTDVTNSRAANLTIAGQVFRVSQANACTYQLDQTSANVSSGGGRFGVRVITLDGCPWTARGSESWLTVGPASGSGIAVIDIDVAPNPGGQRNATVTIANLRVQVAQEGR